MTEKPRLRLSPSQLKVWGTCQEMWALNYLDGLKSKEVKQYFESGTYGHELLHHYYHFMQELGLRAGSDELMELMMEKLRSDLDEMNMDNIEIVSNLTQLIAKYISYQSPKKDAFIEIIGVEHALVVDVEFDNFVLVIEGFADLIYRDRYGVYRVRDHKTGSRARTWSNEKVKASHQLRQYGLACRLLGIPVTKVEINFLNSGLKHNPGPRAKPHPVNDFFEFYEHTHNEFAFDQYLKYLEKVGNRILEYTNDRSLVIPNYTEMCATCDFWPICYNEQRGLSTVVVKEARYDRIDRSGKEENAHENTKVNRTSGELGDIRWDFSRFKTK